MTEAALIFPNQLYDNHPAIKDKRKTYIIEDPLFFGDTYHPAKFHKQKLVLHRCSMKRFAKNQKNHVYIDYADASTDKLFKSLKKNNVKSVYTVDPVDYLLKKRLTREANRVNIELHWLDNPNFLTSSEEYEEFFESKSRYHQTDFYIWQRQRLDILMDGDKPHGGKWTYDTENRKKLPKQIEIPEECQFRGDQILVDAIDYVERNFKDHYGTTDNFNYPTSPSQAKRQLEHFLENQIKQFGPYQDAISQRTPSLFHSKISAALNIGLLSPETVVSTVINHCRRNRTPLASLEGFLRQVVGWREFFRAIYEIEGNKVRTANALNHNHKITKKWYEGTLGIPPVDDVIHKLNKTAYAHHIERLMVLGNFMLLCEIHPNDVYRWFMELFIDSYDWVMVPNIYSMSQYADNGLIVTKPYISGSNYILKMSDYKKGEWCEIWDGLYWSFLDKHKTKLQTNPRMKMVYNLLKKMDSSKLKKHKEAACSFLNDL